MFYDNQIPAKRITITGLVQGVFFRAETQKKAQQLGLTGWVKNTKTGGVEIHAEGPADKRKELEEWCWKGPERAEVTDVESEDVSSEHCSSFEIRS